MLLSCLSALPENNKLRAGISKTLMNIDSISLDNLKRVLSGAEGKIIADDQETQAEFLRDAIAHSLEVYIKTDKTIIKISKKSNRICMDIRKDLLPINDINMYINDYQEAIDTDNFIDVNDTDNKSDVGFLSIDLSQSIPLHKVESLIKKIDWEKC